MSLAPRGLPLPQILQRVQDVHEEKPLWCALYSGQLMQRRLGLSHCCCRGAHPLGWQHRGPFTDHTAGQKYSSARHRIWSETKIEINLFIHSHIWLCLVVVMLILKCCMTKCQSAKAQIQTHECNFLYWHITGQARTESLRTLHADCIQLFFFYTTAIFKVHNLMPDVFSNVLNFNCYYTYK